MFDNSVLDPKLVFSNRKIRGFSRQPVIISSVSAPATFPAGIVHSWAFENNLNDSVGILALTDGGVNSYVAGKHSNCAKFTNGNVSTNPSNLPFNLAFTYAIWVKWESGTSLQISNSASDEGVSVTTGNIMTSDASASSIASYSITNNVFHLVVLGGDGVTTQKSSVDGSNYAVGSGTTAAGLLTVTSTSTTSYIDELCFWPRLLTQAEVNNLWNGNVGTFN